MSETWLPFCIRRDGPADKQGYPLTPERTLSGIAGIVLHSMEGYRAGAYSVLDDPARRSSWTFSVFMGGALPEQHYPLESVTWHAGTRDGNVLYAGIEHEGVKGEPLTDWQYEQTIEIQLAVMALCPNVVPERRVGLWEHREVGQTSCPNGRIDWGRILPALQGEEPDLDETQDTRLKNAEENTTTALRWARGNSPHGMVVKADDGSPEYWLVTVESGLVARHVTAEALPFVLGSADEVLEVEAAALARVPKGPPLVV